MNPDLEPLARHVAMLDGQRPERLAQVHERVGVARRRRRGLVVGAAGAVAAAAVVVAALASGLGDQRGSGPQPVAPTPSDAGTQRFPALSPEEIRRHPDAESEGRLDYPATASPVAARVWGVCLDDCSRATEHLPGEYQTALEVSDDGFTTGALYSLDLSENISHVIDDWYLVDSAGDGPVLVDPRGHRRALAPGASGPVTDVAGPLVHGRSGLAYVDMEARTVHEVEGGDWQWQGAGDTWYWGTASLYAEDGTVTRHAAVWRRPDGTLAAEVLPIGDSDGGPGMLTARTPGTMAVVEHYAAPRVAHVSTDYGATWQVREVPAGVDSGGSLPGDWTSWPVP